MIAAHPLAWPEGWKRTPGHQRKSATFGKNERKYNEDRSGSWNEKRDLTVSDGVERVLRALAQMRIDRQDVVVSTNVRTRLDGLPRSGEPKPADPGAAVYWQGRRGEAPRVMAIDRYDEVADNLAAIALTLDAMRAIERHGGAAILERAFTGFTALPAPGQTTAPSWRMVLDFADDEPVNEFAINAAYRRMASQHHPDKGGNADMMARINAARDQALQSLRAAP